MAEWKSKEQVRKEKIGKRAEVISRYPFRAGKSAAANWLAAEAELAIQNKEIRAACELQRAMQKQGYPDDAPDITRLRTDPNSRAELNTMMAELLKIKESAIDGQFPVTKGDFIEVLVNCIAR